MSMMKILFFSFMLMFQSLSIQLIFMDILMFIIMFCLNVNNLMNYNLIGNFDFMSLSLMMLSLWLLVLIMFSQFSFSKIKSLNMVFILLNMILLVSFMVNSILMFYFFFECSLIPIFMIIMGWGYQMERMKSSFYLLMYTLFASLPLLMMILLVNFYYSSLNMCFVGLMFKLKASMIYSFMIFMAFLVKFPMFFFHQWLPKAHVEAPVGGSMILAGILLKLGGYGMVRMTFFMEENMFSKMMMMYCLMGGSILSIVCLMNSDMKVMIAYSSVVHMALIIVNLFSKNSIGLVGSVIIMIAHGLCSSGMFSCANMIYERSHSRMIMLNKAFLNFFPSVAMFWFLLCMANFGGPFSLNLLGEIILIMNLSNINFIFLFFIFFISFFSAAYSLILYSNLQQGQSNTTMYVYKNISSREMMILISHIWPLLILLLVSNMM